jgi:hypothetical protein
MRKLLLAVLASIGLMLGLAVPAQAAIAPGYWECQPTLVGGGHSSSLNGKLWLHYGDGVHHWTYTHATDQWTQVINNAPDQTYYFWGTKFDNSFPRQYQPALYRWPITGVYHKITFYWSETSWLGENNTVSCNIWIR